MELVAIRTVMYVVWVWANVLHANPCIWKVRLQIFGAFSVFAFIDYDKMRHSKQIVLKIFILNWERLRRHLRPHNYVMKIGVSARAQRKIQISPMNLSRTENFRREFGWVLALCSYKQVAVSGVANQVGCHQALSYRLKGAFLVFDDIDRSHTWWEWSNQLFALNKNIFHDYVTENNETN